MSVLHLLGFKSSSRNKSKGFQSRRESTANSETFILEPIYTPMGVVDTDGDDADIETPIDIGNDAIEPSPPDDTDNNDAGGDSEPDSSDTGGDESANSSDPDAIDVSENNADDVVDDDIGDEMDFIDPDGEAEGETGDSSGEDTADSDTSDNTVDSDTSNTEENQEDSTGDTEDSTDDSSEDAADTDNTDDTEDSSDDSSEETVGTDGGDETEDSSGDSSDDAADTNNTDDTEDSTDDNSEETAGDTDNSTDDGSEETAGTDGGDETEDSTDNSNDDDADTDDSSEETAGETDDSTDDSSEETVAGDSDETDDTATDNLDDGESDTESEDEEGDDIVDEEEDDSDEEEEDDEATDKFELPNFESGVWTVGESGKVDIDFLHDGGAYQGDLGIFSLKGLEELTFETIEDFIAETAARVNSNSKLGYVAISDSTEGARFDGSAGEGKNWNSGDYRGVKTFEFDAGDRVGFMLVPNGSVSKVVDNPGIEGASRPLYSMSTANPDDEFHFGQVADVTGDGSTFVIEDVRADKNSDKDYNDVVFQVRGATGNAVHVSEVIDGDKDWRDSDVGQALIAYSDPYVNPQPVQTPDAGETAGDGGDVASGNETDTENGDDAIEDDTETEVTNTENGGQTYNNSGADIGEINFPDEPTNSVDLGEENGSGDTAIDPENPDDGTTIVVETPEENETTNPANELADLTAEIDKIEIPEIQETAGDPLPVTSNYTVPEFKFEFPEIDQPIIGIIDTGFAEGNPDINYENITFGTDFVDGDDNPLLSEGEGNEHGTHVLGQIAAKQDNGIGIDGINDDAPIWLGRAIGSGEWTESLVEFVNSAKESGQPNAVVNLSLDLTQVNEDGSVTTRYELTPKERAAIEYARQNDILLVVSSGNDNGVMSALGQASQEFDNIITVGAAERVNDEIALSESYNRAAYSSYGYGLDVVADGGTVDNPILSTTGDGVGTMAGTSVAASKVTGTISQVWAANPELSYRQVIEIVKDTATDLNTPNWDPETGAGLINGTAAVLLAKATKPEPHFAPSSWIPDTWSGAGTVTPSERAVATEFMGKYYEWQPYTIQSGDTLSAIALRTMGSASASYYNFIAQRNGIANPNLIYPGTTISVPYEVSAPSPPPNLNNTVGYDGTSTHQTYIDTFNRNGGSSRLGSPTNNVHPWANGYTQDFSGGSDGKGAIMKSNANDRSYWVGGDFWNKFLDAGGADGILKYPTSDRYSTNGGERQNFQGGAIIKSSNGIFPLFGGIGHHYLTNEGGQTGRLGFPTTGEVGIGNGVIVQHFENGKIVYGDGPTRTEMTGATPTPPPPEPDPGYYPDLESLSDSQWNEYTKDNTRFDVGWPDYRDERHLTPQSIRDIYTDLSKALFGKRYPVTAGYLLDPGYRQGIGKWHSGLDIDTPIGEPVKAVVGGTIVRNIQETNGDRFIGVRGDDGKLWVYGHLNGVSVPSGRIEAGQQLGTIGSADHLHLEVQAGPHYRRSQSADLGTVRNATLNPIKSFWELKNANSGSQSGGSGGGSTAGTFSGQVIATIGAYLRATPNANGTPVGTANYGATLTFDQAITGEYVSYPGLGTASDQWYKVAGKNQWISAALINGSPQASLNDPPATPGEQMQYIVKPGDTLWGIAQRFLNDGSRWRELQKADGSTFTEADAQSLQVGQSVYIPVTYQQGTGNPVTDRPDSNPGTDSDIKWVNFSGTVGPSIGVNLRYSPRLSDRSNRNEAYGKRLEFDGWKYGETVTDIWLGTPDSRWFKVKGTNLWVPSAYIWGNPPKSESNNDNDSGEDQAPPEGKDEHFEFDGNQVLFVTGNSVDSENPNDYYSFSISERSNLFGKLLASQTAGFTILTKDGRNLKSVQGNAARASWILEPGDYKVRVSRQSSDTKYSLRLERTSLNGDIFNGEHTYQDGAELYRHGLDGSKTYQGIERNKDTIILIHGWTGNIDSFKSLISATAKRYPNHQILGLDWHEPSNRTSPHQATYAIAPVANWMKQTLEKLGVSSSKLSLFGHSLGAYMSAEIGRVLGKVKSIVALDPAYPGNLYDVDGTKDGQQPVTDFREAAHQSTAFVVSDQGWLNDWAGDAGKAATAHDSFVVEFDGTSNSSETHGAVKDVFESILDKKIIGFQNYKENAYHDNGKSYTFSFGRNKHEGVIETEKRDGKWQYIDLRTFSGGDSSRWV